jgi:hypothetical protein
MTETNFSAGGFSKKGYKDSLYDDADYLALAHALRVAGGKLAIEAVRVTASSDGHHRLALAVVEWLTVISNERKYRLQ